MKKLCSEKQAQNGENPSDMTSHYPASLWDLIATNFEMKALDQNTQMQIVRSIDVTKPN